jgi:tRNA 2-thiouridine synthesizing protein A
MRVDLELDTSGLMCPLPLLRLKKALLSMEEGQIVRVLATDPASVLDFGVFLEQAGHEMLERAEDTGVFRYLIRKR